LQIIRNKVLRKILFHFEPRNKKQMKLGREIRLMAL
jgi:hypothetical protein